MEHDGTPAPVPDGATGQTLVKAMQACPVPDIGFTPASLAMLVKNASELDARASAEQAGKTS